MDLCRNVVRGLDGAHERLGIELPRLYAGGVPGEEE